MFKIAVDEKSYLQLLQEHHAEELFARVEQNRRYLRTWLPWLDRNTTVEHTRAFIRASLEQVASRNGFSCGLWHGGALAGVVGLHAIDWANRKSGIGYWVGESYQGRGLISRACSVLLDHLFGELGLNCVEIACAPGNRRSCAIPERLGFTREGVLRKREWLYDHFEDHVVYSMLAEEWQARRAPKG